MATAILVFTSLAGLIGIVLVWLAIHYKTDNDPVVETINTLLPQTQCAQCGYPGCKPYANAIAHQDEAINRCPPGGQTTIQALAKLLGRDVVDLDSAVGEEKPDQIAVIDENRCIGCKLCIQACPVDAILGTAKRMHTVINDECTGCELCVPPCPVDCIELITVNFDRYRSPIPLKVPS